MSRQSKLNIFVFAIFVLMLLFSYLFFQGDQKPDKRIFSLESHDVKSIKINYIDSPSNIHIEKSTGGLWEFRKLAEFNPSSFSYMRPSEWKIQNILRILATEYETQIPSLNVNPIEFGLVNPRVILELNEVRIVFGDVNPLIKKRYIQVGDTIYIITDRYYKHIIAEPLQYISLSPLEGKQGIEEIDLPDITLRKSKNNGSWLVDSMVKLSPDQVNTFIDEWKFSQALSLSTTRPAQAAKFSANLRTTDGQAYQFDIFLTQDMFILGVKQSGLFYHYPLDAGKRLVKPALENRE
ncbi:MAG: DUF4340 domain-containing protein [Gammaproteobacteria bacterium]|nr:DUF4340 domain-containing protein [Gammaproteobacteria bacterium]